MRNLKVTVEYDGTGYFGFQKQPGRPTVQGELERALTRLTGSPVRVAGAGRTDTGVHAKGQVISFKTGCSIPIERVCIATNRLLPPDIVARAAEEATNDFHARFSARSRVYRYTLCEGPRSAFLGRYAFCGMGRLDTEVMQSAADALPGTRDFFAFSAGTEEGENTVRDLKRVRLFRKGAIVGVTVEANAFLHHMVRILVAALVDVGTGRLPPECLITILERRQRPAVPWIAPACGLCLMQVKYV
ncbi:MAG: tRNA pseudouridine(38-40) synthase TruA [Armatimonadetes bacterium]|nr:tRNA pseudouridine(38-40) synthase TruA [Armatimonadota bacterium]